MRLSPKVTWKGAPTVEGAKFIIGLQPDLAGLERQPEVRIIERFEGEVTAVLLRVPANKSSHVKRWFRGVSHVYDTEQEARRVWGLFGR